MNRSFGRAKSMSHHGFTLIELLVVIAIIAILAAILFPVFAQAKLAAKKAAGLAQMKQMSSAVIMYAGDYDDGIPTWDWYQAIYPAGAYRDGIWASAGSPQTNKRMWDALILPYVKSDNFDKAAAVADAEWGGIFKSPGIEYSPKGGRSIGINQLIVWDFNKDNLNAPDTNPNAVNSGGYYWLNLGQVEKPAETMFTGDTGTGGRYEPIYFQNGFQETFGFLALPANGKPAWSRPWRYGKDSANYSWLDGHARSMKGDKLWPNPNKTTSATSWTTAQRLQLTCAAAKYQAATAGDRELLAAIAGPTCNP